MKIKPQQRFIEENEEVFGNPPVVHFLLGTRFDESASRLKTMEAHTRMGTDIHSHGTMPSAGVIRPIEDWSTEDVWEYLIKPDWAGGGDNPFYEVNQNRQYSTRMPQAESAQSSTTPQADMRRKQVRMLDMHRSRG